MLLPLPQCTVGWHRTGRAHAARGFEPTHTRAMAAGRCAAGEKQIRGCCLLPRAEGPGPVPQKHQQVSAQVSDYILKSPGRLGVISTSVSGHGHCSRSAILNAAYLSRTERVFPFQSPPGGILQDRVAFPTCKGAHPDDMGRRGERTRHARFR